MSRAAGTRARFFIVRTVKDIQTLAKRTLQRRKNAKRENQGHRDTDIQS